MGKILNKIIGDITEKRDYRQIESRAKALPGEYATAYKQIKDYIFHTSGIMSMDPLKVLVDMFEEAAANDRQVQDITGPDVAAFADELVRGAPSYFQQQRTKLNNKAAGKSK